MNDAQEPAPIGSRRRLSPFVRRVTVCFALLFVLTGANGVFAIAQLGRIDDGSQDAQIQGLASAAVLGQLSATLQALRAAEAAQLLDREATDLLTQEAERRQLLARLTKNVREYESLDSSDEQKRLFMKFLANWYVYARQSQTVFEAVAHQDKTKASAAFIKNKVIFDEASETIAELFRINIQQGQVIQQTLHGIYKSSLWFILVSVGAVGLMIIGIVLAVAWHDER
jgi:methyl-accepting chemotaxis protein